MKSVDIRNILRTLTQTRASIRELIVPNSGGIYAIYLSTESEVDGFPAGKGGLLYLGSTSDLTRREFENHLNTSGTGFSTLRRTLGAILKANLGLEAIPRSSGTSETNVRNYKLLPDGEDRLTEWIIGNLDVGVCPILAEYKSVERRLIASVKPILNLTGWNNPYRKEISALRKVCADEARQRRAG